MLTNNEKFSNQVRNLTSMIDEQTEEINGLQISNRNLITLNAISNNKD